MSGLDVVMLALRRLEGVAAEAVPVPVPTNGRTEFQVVPVRSVLVGGVIDFEGGGVGGNLVPGAVLKRNA